MQDLRLLVCGLTYWFVSTADAEEEKSRESGRSVRGAEETRE